MVMALISQYPLGQREALYLAARQFQPLASSAAPPEAKDPAAQSGVRGVGRTTLACG